MRSSLETRYRNLLLAATRKALDGFRARCPESRAYAFAFDIEPWNGFLSAHIGTESGPQGHRRPLTTTTPAISRMHCSTPKALSLRHSSAWIARRTARTGACVRPRRSSVHSDPPWRASRAPRTSSRSFRSSTRRPTNSIAACSSPSRDRSSLGCFQSKNTVHARKLRFHKGRPRRACAPRRAAAQHHGTQASVQDR